MNVATIIARVLLGLLFIFFGSNGFLNFIPMPANDRTTGGEFINSMNVTGYLTVIAALQLIGGALLLVSRYVSLGLTLLGPVIVNIGLFHIFMDRSGLAMAGLVSALSLFLLWRYRADFPAIFGPAESTPR